MQRRKDLRTGSKAYPSKYSGKSCLSGLLICGQCGGVMRRHVQYRKGGGIGYLVCQRHDQGSCSMMQIKEKVIIDGLQMVIRQILFQKEPLYTEMTDTIINSVRKAHKSKGLRRRKDRPYNYEIGQPIRKKHTRLRTDGKKTESGRHWNHIREGKP